MINCFRKQNTNSQIYTMIPPSSLLKSTSSTDLYTEIEERIPNITNIKDFTDLTIYRGEIQNTLKKSKDLQGFHRYILEYSENVKWQSKCIHQLLIAKANLFQK